MKSKRNELLRESSHFFANNVHPHTTNQLKDMFQRLARKRLNILLIVSTSNKINLLTHVAFTFGLNNLFIVLMFALLPNITVNIYKKLLEKINICRWVLHKYNLIFFCFKCYNFYVKELLFTKTQVKRYCLIYFFRFTMFKLISDWI